jgi:WD40 repeat protein
LIKYNISAPGKIFTNANVSRILLINSKKVFIYCTDEKDELGSIRYCKYPLNLSKEIYEIQSHRSKITKIVITYDDNYMFSCGEDGSFICYDFKDNNSKTKLEMPDLS